MTQQPLRRPLDPRRRACAPGELLAWALALALLTPALQGQGVPGAGTPSTPGGGVVERSDSLLQAGASEEAFAVLAEHLASAPDDFEARWRAVRLAVSLSVVGPSHGIRSRWALEADAHGRELLRVRPDDPEALAWAAAARGRHALHEEGMRTPARLAKETWSLTEALLARYPGHPLGNHVRGKLCQQVAGLPRAARLFGRMFLGGELVGQATWVRAEEHHLRAVTGDPGMVFFYLELGETLAAQGKSEAAARVFQAGLAVPARFPVDQRFKRMMSERLDVVEGPLGADLRYDSRL
ncbi:MAG TPA: hypothetical protein VLH75_07695 [Longimicrobiales bacterium]|nr:hypothetical protein [Longimicrobiales bacterium]